MTALERAVINKYVITFKGRIQYTGIQAAFQFAVPGAFGSVYCMVSEVVSRPLRGSKDVLDGLSRHAEGFLNPAQKTVRSRSNGDVSELCLYVRRETERVRKNFVREFKKSATRIIGCRPI